MRRIGSAKVTGPIPVSSFHPVNTGYRGVAQLVAHYLREVGAASSNLVTPMQESRLARLFCYAHWRAQHTVK